MGPFTSIKRHTCFKEILTVTCMFPVLLTEEMEAQSASKYSEGDKISYYNMVYACLHPQTSHFVFSTHYLTHFLFICHEKDAKQKLTPGNS